MDLEKRVELITRAPAEETLTTKELRELLETKQKPVHYQGFEISGLLHLGSLIVSGHKLSDFIGAGFETTVFLADWHSVINHKLGGDWEKIRRAAKYYEEAFKFITDGKIKVRLGSDVYHDNDGYWKDVINFMQNSTLLRTTRCMQIMGRKESETLDMAQYMYPAMQAVDIHALGVDVAHAGVDQRKVHVLAREVFPQITWKAPIAVHHHLLPGLAEPEEGARKDCEGVIESIKKYIPELIRLKNKVDGVFEGCSRDLYRSFKRYESTANQKSDIQIYNSSINQLNADRTNHKRLVELLIDRLNLFFTRKNSYKADSEEISIWYDEYKKILNSLRQLENVEEKLFRFYGELLIDLNSTLGGEYNYKKLRDIIKNYHELVLVSIESDQDYERIIKLILNRMDRISLYSSIGEKDTNLKLSNKKEDMVISSKMSKSKPWTCVFIHDTRDQIAEKMKKAWCPEKVVEGNPVLEMIRYVVLRDGGSFTMERPAKYGGTVSYDDPSELENDYASGKIHPLDLKNALVEPLDGVIRPVREHFEKPANRKLLDVYSETGITR